MYKRRLDSSGNVINPEGEKHEVGPQQDPELESKHNGTYCGSCYGAGSEGECCNSCEEVRPQISNHVNPEHVLCSAQLSLELILLAYEIHPCSMQAGEWHSRLCLIEFWAAQAWISASEGPIFKGPVLSAQDLQSRNRRPEERHLSCG